MFAKCFPRITLQYFPEGSGNIIIIFSSRRQRENNKKITNASRDKKVICGLFLIVIITQRPPTERMNHSQRGWDSYLGVGPLREILGYPREPWASHREVLASQHH